MVKWLGAKTQILYKEGIWGELESVDVFVTSKCIHLYILYCISLYLDVPPIGRVIKIINSCKFIEKLFIVSRGNSPHSWGLLGLLDSPSEVDPVRVKVKWKTSINREWDSLFGTHTHSKMAHEWERSSSHKWEREQMLEIIFVSFGFTFSIGAHSIFEEVVGFFLYVFLEDKSFCLLSLVIDCCACYSLR